MGHFCVEESLGEADGRAAIVYGGAQDLEWTQAVEAIKDAASGWRQSGDEVLMRRSRQMGSGADHSNVGWAHKIERPGVIKDQSLCRSSAAEASAFHSVPNIYTLFSM